MNHDGTGRGQLITNLPADGCVELSCMVDRNGINPTRFGGYRRKWRPSATQTCGCFDLGRPKACVEKSKEAAIHALLLGSADKAAVCTPAQIKAMTWEMFEAEKEFLPGFR